MTLDFLIIGAGIFGVTTAIELRKRNYTVGLLDRGEIPHLLAASTDISKIVRMEYGSDETYFKMAEASIEGWKQWNELFNEELYHETGMLQLCKKPISDTIQAYEKGSLNALQKHNYSPSVLTNKNIEERFPQFSKEVYQEAVYNPNAGFVSSGRAIEVLVCYAKELGVNILTQRSIETIHIKGNKVEAITTNEDLQLNCGALIISAGADTSYLVPELKPFMKATGHPVFWLKPENPSLFLKEKLPVFMADISNSGWYGFPLDEKKGVVKIARHSSGEALNPISDDRIVRNDEIADMKEFIQSSIQSLASASLVYTRKCLYTDTHDGHYWIDWHPQTNNMLIATGGSGHAYKMGPILGKIVADKAERIVSPYENRFRWRDINSNTRPTEESRYKPQ